jgi:hypothetical protein
LDGASKEQWRSYRFDSGQAGCDAACVSIKRGGAEFHTADFRRDEWQMVTPIVQGSW